MSIAAPVTGSRHVLAAPVDFDFRRTVRSHGWYDLPPFGVDPTFLRLEVVLRPGGGRPVLAVITPHAARLRMVVVSRRPLSPGSRRDAIRQVRSCLRIDEDFSGFHDEARRHPRYRWIAASGSGRLLRSPTVFEDIVKMICTTNCSWALTRIMVANLVHRYGEPLDGERRAFPTPDALAGATEQDLRRDVKAGYRAPFLLRFAGQVAGGVLNVESWRDNPLDTEDLFAALRQIRGVGPYAAGNLLKLLGRYDYLGLDSWVRGQYATLHTGGRPVRDATIERRYRRYGKWRGLFFWLEMTRYWHEEKFPGRAEHADQWVTP